jgi:hypothetical protein
MFITENYYDPEAHENRLTELFELSCSADGFERENKFVDLAPVAKRHGFEDMVHANMSEAIQGSERLQREFEKVYYCVYRD